VFGDPNMVKTSRLYKNWKQFMHATALTQQVSVAAAPSDGTPAIATEGFRGLSQTLRANYGIMPRLLHNRRFRNPYLLFTVLSSAT
jgi:hypothetical protein